MAKQFVLRAGALLSRKKAYLAFGEAGDHLVIPMAIVEKLHYFEGAKRNMAADVSEYIKSCPNDELLGKGYVQSNGTILSVKYVEDISSEVNRFTELSLQDKQCLQICLNLQKEFPDDEVILVSKSTPLLLKAEILKIKSMDAPDMIYPSIDRQYSGVTNYTISTENFNALMTSGKVFFQNDDPSHLLYPNEFLMVNDESYSSGVKLARFDGTHIVGLNYQLNKDYQSKNAEQSFLTEALFTPPEVAPLVIVKGPAGTGKTYVTVTAALELTKYGSGNYSHVYDRIIIATPTVSGGNEEIGFLPGDVNQKVGPYLGGIYDNIINSFVRKNREKAGTYGYSIDLNAAQDCFNQLMDDGTISIQQLGTVAGHSFENSIIIVDEAQNVDPNYFLDIVTRTGEGSKLVVLGDPSQVKSPKLDSRINGINYMMECWKTSRLAYQISMNADKVVRGSLCQEALKLMN